MRIDKVPLFGSALGLTALLLPFAAIKPNRIAEGRSLGFFAMSVEEGGAVSGSVAVGLLVAAVFSVFFISLFFSRLRSGYVYGFAGMLILALLFDVLVGTEASVSTLPHGRVTPSSGFWLSLLSVFFVIDSALREGRVEKWFSLFLKSAPLLLIIYLLFSGSLDHLAIMKEFFNREARFLTELYSHIALSAVAVAAAMIIGVPLGVSAWRKKRMERSIFSLVNGIQTIPSLALFGLMIAPLALLSQAFPVLRSWGIKGIGNTPALIALTLYSLLPIVRNTYTGLAMIPEGIIDAGTGLGMSKRHVLRYIEIPLAVPVVLGGIRVSAVITVGNTAVAALIGAGGLGNFVFQGLGQAAPDLILMGVLPIILLAVLADRGFGLLVSALSPPGFGIVEQQEEGAR
ncbi:MAG: ABC transporter permease [Spirochaetaceae bacterium]